LRHLDLSPMLTSLRTARAISVRGARGLKVAVTGATGAVGAGVLSSISSLPDVTLSVFGADATAGKGVSQAGSLSECLKGAEYALVLGGDAAAAVSAATPTTMVSVMGCTTALKASKAGSAPVTAITGIPAAAAAAELASKTGGTVTKAISWGDGVADLSHALVDGKWAIPLGAAPLPAPSEPGPEVAADAIVAHLKALAMGTDGEWISMGVPAVGDFGTGEGIYYSVPVVCTPGAYKRVGGITLTPEVAEAMEASRVALVAAA